MGVVLLVPPPPSATLSYQTLIIIFINYVDHGPHKQKDTILMKSVFSLQEKILKLKMKKHFFDVKHKQRINNDSHFPHYTPIFISFNLIQHITHITKAHCIIVIVSMITIFINKLNL